MCAMLSTQPIRRRRLQSFTVEEIEAIEARGMHLEHLLKFMEAVLNEAKNQQQVRLDHELRKTFAPEEYELYF